MRTITFLAAMLLSVAVHAASGTYAGINLEQGNALQLQLCSLKPGKSMSNYERVFNDYIDWSKENDVEVFALRIARDAIGRS